MLPARVLSLGLTLVSAYGLRLQAPFDDPSDRTATLTHTTARYMTMDPKASEHIAAGSQVVRFADVWQVVGPFQIGTREAAWGADPLEFYGGFPFLEYEADTEFASSLANNGTVSWQSRPFQHSRADGDAAYEIPIAIGFPEVDIEGLRQIYGWAAAQFQAWGRVEFEVTAASVQRTLLYTDQIIEFAIDGQRHFGGDFFAFRHAPTVLWLEPGKHRLDVRLIRDVRSMGGFGPAAAECHLTLKALDGLQPTVAVEQGVVPDFLDTGAIAGKYASIKIRNDEKDAIELIEVEAADISDRAPKFSLPTAAQIAPGQTREVLFQLSPGSAASNKLNSFSLAARFRRLASNDSNARSHETEFSHVVTFTVAVRAIDEAHKFTFLHPSGAVSYAIIEPPRAQTVTAPNTTLPVLLNLHGAGLEVDSAEIRNLFKDLGPFAFWLVHPLGMTTWSSDDWHTWGSADAEAAVAAIEDWIAIVDWQGPGADRARYHVIGHSNGGQGTWYTLTHRPDRIISAAAVSGYTSIEFYVPFQFWRVVDPAISSVLSAGKLSFRHELLADNLAGIPIYQQHGGADSNVPVYHSRNMFQLASEASAKTNYLELPGQEHWYDGILATDHLRAFYRSINASSVARDVPSSFVLTATPAGDVKSRYGVAAEQFWSPYQLGKIRGSFITHGRVLILLTSNIKAFSFDKIASPANVQTLLIDGQTMHVHKSEDNKPQLYINADDGTWKLHDYDSGLDIRRHNRQLGGLDAILRTTETLLLLYQTPGHARLANQISQNLYQYFRADVAIVLGKSPGKPRGNSIRMLQGHPDSFQEYHEECGKRSPIKFDAQGLMLRQGKRNIVYPYVPGMGAYFVSPLGKESVQIVVWGHDLEGLERIARLLPTTTGVGQPDFVIMGREAAWKGAGGSLAMGFFDHSWEVAPGSFLS